MASTAEPRSGEERKRDTIRRLTEDIDSWVSTADPAGAPTMVPLSFTWHRGLLLMTTRARNPTTLNIATGGRAVIALGHTRDVVLIDASAEVVPTDAVPDDEGDAFQAKKNWDTRGRPEWVFLRFRPVAVRAWREKNELRGRELMRAGDWLV